MAAVRDAPGEAVQHGELPVRVQLVKHSAAASIATGWSEPVPGRELHPLESSALHGALLRQLRYHSPNEFPWVRDPPIGMKAHF